MQKVYGINVLVLGRPKNLEKFLPVFMKCFLFSDTKLVIYDVVICWYYASVMSWFNEMLKTKIHVE